MRAGTRKWAWVAGCVGACMALVPSGRGRAADVTEEIRAAGAAYAAAFNKGDFAALADQWTERATLVEGSLELAGREAIMASLRAWRERHPQATMAIEAGRVELLAEPVARVDGRITFTSQPGAKPVVSRFTSLRVREGTTWRLAESLVVPEHAFALDQLDWLLGTWTAETAGDGPKTTVETIYEKPLGAYCIVGRSRIRPADGPAIEALEIIHADRGTGLIRTWVFDSTGAQAEGVVESDGTTLSKSLVGTPSDRVAGRVARWTQLVSPTGEGRCTMHAIERSIDGAPVADGEPLNFRKVR